eukprot:TRINITY_DN2166_c0_g1_i1.p1 TRINITY_DN2166_c0_g1~~TRINITY_DN2166_c0_g1_i1.p1  ORF type:complete len:309 (-),score=78.01 TRINITY_DN2166_c0_g1_i1:124-1050(-)
MFCVKALRFSARPLRLSSFRWLSSNASRPQDPIDLLMYEHQVILRTLSSLECFAQRTSDIAANRRDPLPSSTSLPHQSFAQFVRFIREYADELHHQKEEKILFEKLVRFRAPLKYGPVGVMLQEHDLGRELTQLMVKIPQRVWDERELSTAIDLSRAYTDLLRQHIQKEDRILYPLARRLLPERMMKEVELECARYDEGKQKQIIELEQISTQLIKEYPESEIDHTVARESGCGCGHGGGGCCGGGGGGHHHHHEGEGGCCGGGGHEHKHHHESESGEHKCCRNKAEGEESSSGEGHASGGCGCHGKH